MGGGRAAHQRHVPGTQQGLTMLAGPCLHATGWRCVLQWHYDNRCSLQGVDYQCGCATPQAACKPVGTPGTPSYW